MKRTATTAAADEIIRYSLWVILLFSDLFLFEGGVTNALLSITKLLDTDLNSLSYDRVDDGVIYKKKIGFKYVISLAHELAYFFHYLFIYSCLC